MNKNNKKPKFKLFCFIISFFVLAIYLYVSSNRLLEELAQNSFSSLISSASYNAIDKMLEPKYDYKSLVSVTTDNSGQINMVMTDSYKVNAMASSVATNAYEYLVEYTKRGVEVPFLAFTGIRLISGFGTPIKMKLISVSSVKCEIISDFKQAGINQTRHSLYINIYCTVSLITKTSSKTVQDKITVMIYDNLIIGKVPDVFVNSQVIGTASEK